MMITCDSLSPLQRMTGKVLLVSGLMMVMLWETILIFQIFPIKEDSTRAGGTGKNAETSMNQ